MSSTAVLNRGDLCTERSGGQPDRELDALFNRMPLPYSRFKRPTQTIALSHSGYHSPAYDSDSDVEEENVSADVEEEPISTTNGTDKGATEESMRSATNTTPVQDVYTSVLENAGICKAKTDAPKHDASPAEDYIGFDRLTNDETINAYVDALNRAGFTLFSSYAPLFMDSFWVSTRRIGSILKNREQGPLTQKQLLVLYNEWHTRCVKRLYKYFDMARAIIVPVHDPDLDHWSLIVASPRARHAVVLCSMASRRVLCDNSAVLQDEYRVATPRVAEALVIISRMTHISDELRRLRTHVIGEKQELRMNTTACHDAMKQRLGDLDPMMLHNAPNFSYSFGVYGEPQQHLDCGVYTLWMMRQLLFQQCNDDAELETLYNRALMHSVQNGVRWNDATTFVDEHRGKTLMHFLLNETRPLQIHAAVQLVASRVNHDVIASARVKILRELKDPSCFLDQGDDLHPDVRQIMKHVVSHMQKIPAEKHASAVETRPEFVAGIMLKMMLQKSFLGKKRQRADSDADSTPEQSGKRVCTASEASEA